MNPGIAYLIDKEDGKEPTFMEVFKVASVVALCIGVVLFVIIMQTNIIALEKELEFQSTYVHTHT